MSTIAFHRDLAGFVARSAVGLIRWGDAVCVRTLHVTSGLDGFYRLPGPRQELVEPIDGISVDHALEHVDEIGVWLEAVELGGFDQGADDRPTFAAAVAAGKEMILPSESYGTNRALDWIGVEFDAAVMQKARQSVPTRKRIADRFGQRAAPRYAGQLRLEPIAQGLDDGCGKGPPFGKAASGGLPAHPRLDGIEFADPAQCFGRHGRARGFRDFVELAPCVRPAGGEHDLAIRGQRSKPA